MRLFGAGEVLDGVIQVLLVIAGLLCDHLLDLADLWVFGERVGLSEERHDGGGWVERLGWLDVDGDGGGDGRVPACFIGQCEGSSVIGRSHSCDDRVEDAVYLPFRADDVTGER